MKLLSIVVPVFNEEENVAQLIKNIATAMSRFQSDWEAILVDDGSSDNTYRILKSEADPYRNQIRVVQLQRNFGQTAAMQAGIDLANGDIIATLDGDLQNDPEDIPAMVQKLIDEDQDLIVGWRKKRKDNLFIRKVPSWLANRLISAVTKVKIHDYGCSLKIYRASVIKSVRLYGEMHRFIPAWITTVTQPGRISEYVVKHHARQFGASKYGISRTFRVILDLISVFFFLRFKARPGHFFGSISLVMGLAGVGILSYLSYLKLVLGESIGQRPLLILGVLLTIGSIQLITTGIVSEFIARTYFEASNMKSYVIREDLDTDSNRSSLPPDSETPAGG